MKAKLADGREYEFAPVTFTRDAVRLIELFEEIAATHEAQQPVKSYGELLRVLRAVMADSLIRGGQTPEQADAAIGTLPLGADLITYIEPVKRALGLD